MNRHKALTIAGATVATLSGAAAAFAVNLGLLGSAGAAVPGNLEADQAIAAFHVADPTKTTAVPPATTAEPELIIRYEDVYVTAPPPSARVATAPATAPAERGPVMTTAPAAELSPSSTTTFDDRAEYEDDEFEHEDDEHEDDEFEHEDDEHEDDEHEDDEHEDDEFEHEDDEHEARDGDEDDD